MEIRDLFAGHAGAYGTHGEPVQKPGSQKWEIKSTAATHRGAVTPELWAAHLEGRAPLGVIPIREDDACLWGSIDVDTYGEDLLGLVAAVERAGFPLVPCRSKSGGMHLFLFLSDPQPAEAVISVLRDMAARLGLSSSEIFPKQTRLLSERGDLGNWMVMPYFGSTYGGRLCAQVGVKRTGAEQTLGEFLATAAERRLGAAAFADLARQRTPRGSKSIPPARPFGDGPVCLEHLAGRGVEEHEGRNNALFMMGLYYKRSQPARWQECTEEANRLYLQPPLGADEVTATLRSLARREYEYTCRAQPMCAHCDAGACRTRRFGVGAAGNYPTVTSLTRMDTDPPVWFVDVDGHRYECSTKQLLNYNAMLELFAEGNHIYRTMRQDSWLMLLAEPMDNMVVQPAPPDAGVAGMFHELLEDLLVNRWRGAHREDLLRGKPWEDEAEGRHYFRLRDLMMLLRREGSLRDLSRPRVARMVEQMGGGHHGFNIKGHFLNVWWVPTAAVTPRPTTDPPEPKEKVI